MKEISERHVHVLRKRTLVNDFIVCDLAAEGGGRHAIDLEMGGMTGAGTGAGAGAGQGYDRVPQDDRGGDQHHGSSSSRIYQDQQQANIQDDNGEPNYFSAQQQRTLDRMGLI